MALDPTRVISGTFGEVHSEGQWMTNMYGLEAKIDFDKEEIKVSGSRWKKHKVMAISGSGSIKGYKVTSDLKKKVASLCEDAGKEYRTEIISKLDDPDAFGCERIRLKGVSFDSIDVVNWEVGSVVEEEWPFTFEGFEFLDEIVAD